MNRQLAIITARGGSKRIPRKNIKEFFGKPILVYSLRAALESCLFEEVMVSTDDKEIAEIALAYGAQVPFYRSAATANDYAGTADVLREVLDEYRKRGREFDTLCCLYPTAPFITAHKLRQAEALFQSKHAQVLLPVVKFSYPPQRAFVLNTDGTLVYKWPENAGRRSQDLETFYHDAGQFYFYDVKHFCSGTTEGKTVPFPVSELEVQDIDHEEDWQLAEIKYQLLNRQGEI